MQQLPAGYRRRCKTIDGRGQKNRRLAIQCTSLDKRHNHLKQVLNKLTSTRHIKTATRQQIVTYKIKS